MAPLATAGPLHLAFLEREALLSRLAGAPGALLARPDLEIDLPDTSILRVPDPQLAFARAVRLFHPEPERTAGVHPTAVIGRGAVLGEDVRIGPWTVVGAGAWVGARCDLGPSVLVADGAVLGDDCRIGHAVSILSPARLGDRVVVHEGTRIGTEGYGFQPTSDGAAKIPQIGGCLIEDDVEIGANCTVDRGALSDTRIGARTKLDNLVHVGHNVQIEDDCMIVAQVGIAGSTRIGTGTVLAGQVGIVGHVTIGSGARIGAQSGVIGDVPAGASYWGTPARPHREVLRATASLRKLAGVLKRLGRIEERLGIAREADEAGPDPGGTDDEAEGRG